MFRQDNGILPYLLFRVEEAESVAGTGKDEFEGLFDRNASENIDQAKTSHDDQRKGGAELRIAKRSGDGRNVVRQHVFRSLL